MFKKLIVVLIVIVFFIYDHLTSIGRKYQEEYIQDDNRYITMEGETVIPATVVDYQIIPPYMIGIRLNAKNVECKGMDLVILENVKEYYILNLNNKEQYNYTSKLHFEKKRKRNAIALDEIKLNYQEFEEVCNKYNRYYEMFSAYSECSAQ